MKTILLLIALTLLTSCGKYTTYKIYKSHEVDGVKYETSLEVRSLREFKRFYAKGNSKTGDYEYIADDISTKETVLEKSAAGLFSKIIDKVEIK